MTGEDVTQSVKPPEKERTKDSDSDGDGAEEILEESPCRRWSKRREQVKQRDIPGIDCAFLAMDNETGNEVVWNEVQFSERKNFKVLEAKINTVFDNLTHLVHPNLVNFHKWWTDSKSEIPRSWKKWTTQILSALNYLHSSVPAIIHGNLTSNTVFIQQNGLIKIGSDHAEINPASDIYAFGICALEIAACGSLTGTADGVVTPEAIQKAVDAIEDEGQRDLISSCLSKDPIDRPSARQLLFHPILFEVHSLKLLAAHVIVDSKLYDDCSESVFRIGDTEKVMAATKFTELAPCQLPAFQLDLEKFLEDVRNGIYPLTAYAPLPQPPTLYRAQHNEMTDSAYYTVTSTSSKDKGVDDDIYIRPCESDHQASSGSCGTAVSVSSTRQFHSTVPLPPTRSCEGGIYSHCSAGYGVASTGATSTLGERSPSPAISTLSATATDQASKAEPRTILQMKAVVEKQQLTLLLQLDDTMNRQLVTGIDPTDDALSLVNNLIANGFISEHDADKVTLLLDGCLAEAASAAAAVDDQRIHVDQRSDEDARNMLSATSPSGMSNGVPEQLDSR